MRQENVRVHCHAPLPQGSKYVALHLLTKETLYCVVEVKAKVRDIFDQVSAYLGMKDTHLFGLALKADNEYMFLNQDTKISKYAPKQWKSPNNAGLDGSGKPLVTFLLRIQFYVECHLLIRDKVTRLHYYLQLRENVVRFSQSCSEELYFLLCAYALQADVGNYCADRHRGQYFEPKDYFPQWVLGRVGSDYIVQNLPKMHKDNRGLSRNDAQAAYIREASSSEAPHNMHVYRLRRKKSETRDSIWLGVCPKGVEIYEENGTSKQLWSTFLWTNISKLYFEKKKFEIRAICYPSTRKYTYFASTDEKAKYLLHLCRTTHQFTLAMQPRAEEFRKLELEVKQSYRESYIYSDSFDLEWEQEHGSLGASLRGFNTLPKAGKGDDPRVSVISNTSSNTTSGIVSDRVHSLDGSEDDLELEIMINSPPAPSLESLPFTSDQEDCGYDCQSFAGASPEGIAGCNISDLRSELHAATDSDEIPSSASSTLPLAHNKSSTDAVSRTDSSSSQRSASTVKSRSQQELDHTPSLLPEVEARDLESPCAVYFLPKNHTTTHLHPHVNSNVPRAMTAPYSDDFLPVAADEIVVKDNVTPMPSTSQPSRMTATSSAGSRILTSIGVQAPILPPANLHLSQARTKIGVSSLSRPALANRPLPSFQVASGQRCANQRHPQDPKSPPALLPPTALYGTDEYVPVLSSSHSHQQLHSFPLSPSNFHLEQTAQPSYPVTSINSYDSFATYHSLPPTLDYSRQSSFEYDSVNDSFSVSDISYIPPPPLYANPVPEARTHFGTGKDWSISPPNGFASPSLTFNGINSPHFHYLPAFSPSVTRARSEESCRSLESTEMHHSVSIGRAQSMDRQPRTDSLNYIVPPPPPYMSKPLTNGNISPTSSTSSSTAIGSSRSDVNAPPLDIDNLRKRSKALDLPLISALCNDRSLMPEETTVVPNGHYERRMSYETPSSPPLMATPVTTRPMSWHVSSEVHWALSHASAPEKSSSHWSIANGHANGHTNSSMMTSFSKMSPKHSPVNTLCGGQQMLPMKLSVLGHNGSVAGFRVSKINGINVNA